MWMLLILAGVVGLSLGIPTPEVHRSPPKFTLNLDLDPYNRWAPIVSQYPWLKKDLHEILTGYFYPNDLKTLRIILKDIEGFLPYHYLLEIQGIAATMDMKVGDVVVLNFAYELMTRFSTSIVSQDTQGRIWHTRNIDYPLDRGELLRNFTIEVDFQKGGKTVYTGVTFVGYVGLLTGQKPEAFTVTLNQRLTDQGEFWQDILVFLFDSTSYPDSILVREVLEKSSNYTHAKEVLTNTDTPTTAYFILGGVATGEGVVITKARIGSDDLWYMNEASPGWFLVETMYDHWTTPPEGHDRRDPAIKAMKAMGQSGISVNNLDTIMATRPIRSNQTIYTTVMSAVQPSLLTTWIR